MCVCVCVCVCCQVAGIMDRFERDFEHLDVQSQTMEEAMGGVTTLTVPEVSVKSDSHWICFMLRCDWKFNGCTLSARQELRILVALNMRHHLYCTSGCNVTHTNPV